MFSPACVWCGARLIQRIQALKGIRPKSEIVARCQKVLEDWKALGHSESRLRELAASGNVPLRPEPGREGDGESGRQDQTKRRRAKPSGPMPGARSTGE